MSIKVLNRKLLISLMLFAAAGPLYAAAPCNNSNRKVVTLQDISFGIAGSFAVGGTVDVSPTGFRAATGDVVLLGGTWSAAIFQIQGCANDLVTISLPVAAQALRAGGGGKIDVMNFVTQPTHTTPYILDATGAMQFRAGASLILRPFHPAGVYTGQVAIDILYN
ncbi:MAG: DUF4402 domain-containing protein [Gammaproteobacteria bacterium]|nr:DUF4402 domain-containing protein [Gammaproteobacteria bacterium]